MFEIFGIEKYKSKTRGTVKETFLDGLLEQIELILFIIVGFLTIALFALGLAILNTFLHEISQFIFNLIH